MVWTYPPFSHCILILRHVLRRGIWGENIFCSLCIYSFSFSELCFFLFPLSSFGPLYSQIHVFYVFSFTYFQIILIFLPLLKEILLSFFVMSISSLTISSLFSSGRQSHDSVKKCLVIFYSLYSKEMIHF